MGEEGDISREIPTPGDQSIDIHDDARYPALSLKRDKTRLVEREITNLIRCRDDFAKFSDDHVSGTSGFLYDSGIRPLGELRRSRPVNRAIIFEDLRAQGHSARDLELVIALFAPSPLKYCTGSSYGKRHVASSTRGRRLYTSFRPLCYRPTSP